MIVNYCHYFFLKLNNSHSPFICTVKLLLYLALIFVVIWNVFRLWCFDLCCILCLRSAVTTRRGWDCSLSLHHIATFFHFYWGCFKLKRNASRNKRLCLFLFWQLFLSLEYAFVCVKKGLEKQIGRFKSFLQF